MYFFDTEDLLARRDNLRVSYHALLEAYKEGLRGKDILHAIFEGRIVEHYPERKRVLILGPTTKPDVPLHVVCDYTEPDQIAVVTVYIPDRPDWVADAVRGAVKRTPTRRDGVCYDETANH